MIFQLIDDHSRYALASHVAWSETADAAIAVFDKAVAAHGVPQGLLSDNGLALNYMVGGPYGFHHVLVIVDGDKVTVADLEGEILIEHTRPAPGITYVGNGRPRGPHPKKPRPSPKS